MHNGILYGVKYYFLVYRRVVLAEDRCKKFMFLLKVALLCAPENQRSYIVFYLPCLSAYRAVPASNLWLSSSLSQTQHKPDICGSTLRTRAPPMGRHDIQKQAASTFGINSSEVMTLVLIALNNIHCLLRRSSIRAILSEFQQHQDSDPPQLLTFARTVWST